MPTLSVADLYALVRRHGALPGADAVAVAGALAESGGRTDAKAAGDEDSWGLWQCNRGGGMGTGYSVAQLCDPEIAASIMVPEYNANYQAYLEVLARWTYMATEKPWGWSGKDNPGLYSAAANRFAEQWRGLAQQPATPATPTCPAKPAANHDAILPEARTWLGIPYVYGGQTRQGIDCSGLVIEVLKAVNLWPHGDDTADGIARRLGLREDWDNLHDGDLLFFDWEDDGEIDHIGFRDGYRHILDAQTPGQVVRERALSDWEINHLVGFACPGN